MLWTFSPLSKTVKSQLLFVYSNCMNYSLSVINTTPWGMRNNILLKWEQRCKNPFCFNSYFWNWWCWYGVEPGLVLLMAIRVPGGKNSRRCCVVGWLRPPRLSSLSSPVDSSELEFWFQGSLGTRKLSRKALPHNWKAIVFMDWLKTSQMLRKACKRVTILITARAWISEKFFKWSFFIFHGTFWILSMRAMSGNKCHATCPWQVMQVSYKKSKCLAKPMYFLILIFVSNIHVLFTGDWCH